MKKNIRGYSDLENSQTINQFLSKMGLSEYHSRVLSNLVLLGESGAPKLASSSDVPRSRVYDVLLDLFKMGLVKKKTGKPTIYYPQELSKMTENFKIWLQRKYSEQERLLKDLEEEFKKIKRTPAIFGATVLLRTVQVGAPSEIETKNIIKQAKESLNITTRAFEYYKRVRYDLIKASRNGVIISILMIHPKIMDINDQEIQESTIKWIKKDLPNLEIKFSKEIPIRMTISDSNKPSNKAVLIAEQRGVPLLLREAAITENSSFINMLNIYFQALWKEAKNHSNLK